jgi:hypothetical protein
METSSDNGLHLGDATRRIVQRMFVMVEGTVCCKLACWCTWCKSNQIANLNPDPYYFRG